MGYSAVGLSALSAISANVGLSTNTELISVITEYQNIPTVKLGTQLFANAVTVPDSGLLLSTLESLQNPVLFGFSSNVANFTDRIVSQATQPFSAGVAGFANVATSSMNFVRNSFDIAGSTNLLVEKTYQSSGPGYSTITDLVSAGLGNIAATISEVISKFGTMYDVTRLSRLADPYVFCNNLLQQGFGYLGSLQTQLANVGVTINNILSVPSTVPGTSIAVINSILLKVTGKS